MPNLDGFSAVREIRKTRPGIPVIMLSALGEEYDRIHGFDLGVDDYVVKPFSSKFRVSSSHSSVAQVEKLFVNTAASLSYGGYGDTQGYKPSSKRNPVIYLDGQKHDMYAQL